MSGAECPEWGTLLQSRTCLLTTPGHLAWPPALHCSFWLFREWQNAHTKCSTGMYLPMYIWCISTARSSINFITGTLDRSASQRGNVVQEMQFSLTSDGRYGALHKNTCFFSLLLIILHWYLMLFDTYPPEFAGHVYCADIYNSLCIHHVADVLLLWCDMLYPPATSCPVSCIGRAAPHIDI